jgi:hypothetical protein
MKKRNFSKPTISPSIYVILSILALSVIHSSNQTKPNPLIDAIDNYLLIKPSQVSPELHHIGLGSMDGCLLDEEFWDVYFHLRLKYSNYVSDLENIGYTFEKRHMFGFWLETKSSSIGNAIYTVNYNKFNKRKTNVFFV